MSDGDIYFQLLTSLTETSYKMAKPSARNGSRSFLRGFLISCSLDSLDGLCTNTDQRITNKNSAF